MNKARSPRSKISLSDELYLRFRDLLRTRCGVFYPEHKRNDLAYGLHVVLNSTGHPDLAALCVDAIAGGAAWEAILTQLTVGETYFFRNSAQFDALIQHILPEMKGWTTKKDRGSHHCSNWRAGAPIKANGTRRKNTAPWCLSRTRYVSMHTIY